jgi:protein-disulfide isomerase
MAQALEERIKNTIRVKARRRWYSRWWGRVLLVVIFLFIVWSGAVVVQTIRYYRQYVSGGVIPPGAGLAELRQDAKLDLLHNGNDPSVGPKTAPVTIVAFEDFQCPYCLQAQPLLATHTGDIRFIYKDFPLSSIHPDAQSSAEAAQCAHQQGKFWEYHDELFANQERLAEAFYRATAKKIGLNITAFNECMATGKSKQVISQDVELGRTLGVVGTPTFFVNGELFQEGYSAEKQKEIEQRFEKAIEYIQSL